MCQSTQHTNDNATCFDYKIMIIIRPELQDAKKGVNYNCADPSESRSKTWVCGGWLSGIVGSNHAGGMDVCLL